VEKLAKNAILPVSAGNDECTDGKVWIITALLVLPVSSAARLARSS